MATYNLITSIQLPNGMTIAATFTIEGPNSGEEADSYIRSYLAKLLSKFPAGCCMQIVNFRNMLMPGFQLTPNPTEQVWNIPPYPTGNDWSTGILSTSTTGDVVWGSTVTELTGGNLSQTITNTGMGDSGVIYNTWSNCSPQTSFTVQQTENNHNV